LKAWVNAKRTDHRKMMVRKENGEKKKKKEVSGPESARKGKKGSLLDIACSVGPTGRRERSRKTSTEGRGERKRARGGRNNNRCFTKPREKSVCPKIKGSEETRVEKNRGKGGGEENMKCPTR